MGCFGCWLFEVLFLQADNPWFDDEEEEEAAECSPELMKKTFIDVFEKNIPVASTMQ